jgi:carbon-monoxide dehydrogenase catalytic subunit
VDNSRIEDVLNPVVNRLNQMLGTSLKISDLPVAASAPEFITEKAVSIGTWAVVLGLFTHIGGQPYVSGSANMVDLLTGDKDPAEVRVANLTGGQFNVEQDPSWLQTPLS